MPSKRVSLPGFKVNNRLVLSGSGLGLQQLLQAGSRWLARHVEQVNRVNVFPVPDGDTGTNMLLTMQAAVEATTRLENPSAAEVAAAAARGALFGGRGNSGVILSQFWQGLATGFVGKVSFTALDLADAIKLGVEQAYQSVLDPVEGTILTVARAIAESAARTATTEADLVELLASMVMAAKQAQVQTPRLLPVLAQAGVTDSGGLGLLYIFEGMLRFLDGSLDKSPSVAEGLADQQLQFSPNGHIYGYEVQFIIEGTRLPVKQIQADLSSLGSSSLIVGSARRIKVHLHGSDPIEIVRRAEQFGRVTNLLVEDLTRQAREFARSRFDSRVYNDSSVTISLITLVAGAGLAEIFKEVSQVVEHMSALPEAIKQTPTAQVLILPTAAATIDEAQEAAAAARKSVAVLPIGSIPQAIAALLAFNGQLNLSTNVRRMMEAAQRVRTVSLSPVAPSSLDGSVTWQATLDGQPVADGSDFGDLALSVLGYLAVDKFDLMTIYFGAGGTLAQAERLARQIEMLYPNIQLDVVSGGQSQPNYIIALE